MKLHFYLFSPLLVGFLGAVSSADVSSATVSKNVAWTGDPLALIDHDTTTTAVTYPVDTCDVETKDVGYAVIDMGVSDQLVSGVVLYLEPGNYCNLFLAGWEDGEEEPKDPPSEPIATLKFEPPPTGRPSLAPSIAPSMAPSSAPSKAPSSAPVAPTPAPVAPKPAPVASTEPPPGGLLCHVCTGPVQICEKLHHVGRCPGDRPFCINHIVNSDWGARTVDRNCASYNTCHVEWYLGSSDSDRCQTFQQDNIYTLAFECTYCCTHDLCNEKLHMDECNKDLYKGPNFSGDIAKHYEIVRESLKKAGLLKRHLAEEGSNVHSTGSAHSLVHVPSTGLTIDFKEPKAYRFLKVWVGKHEASSDVKIFEIKPLHSKAKAASKTKTASSNGDPHFKTFSGEKYDFHGGCDLVLLQDPSFYNGLGLTIQIRTKIETWWSFIESAVIQIGDQTIELMGNEDGEEGPRYWVNGLPGPKDVDQDKNLKALVDVLKARMKGFNVHYHRGSLNRHRLRIDLNGVGDAISMETYKSWVSVNVKAVQMDSFKNAKGLMGAYPSGAKLARNGTTTIDDPITFGKEWQVIGSEPMLFHTTEGSIQHPQECAMPDASMKTSRNLRRRLGESMITEEDAALACAHVDEDARDACIFDVLATNDKDMAGSY